MEIDIIFLKVRKFKLLSFRSWISNAIRLFQGEPTHTAYTFEYNGDKFVREMDWRGFEKTDVLFDKYEEYILKFKHRIHSIITLNISTSIEEDMKFLNFSLDDDVKYDIYNLTIKQPIKIFWGLLKLKPLKFKDSVNKRICSEDTSRALNILKPGLIPNPEILSPSELHKYLQSVKNTYI